MLDTVLRSRHVVTPEGERAAAVGLRDGRIAVLAPYDEQLDATTDRVLGGDLALLPGLVDSHVHLQDPGRDWEGFDSGTRAAALGGVTTVVDMPLDSLPVTLDADAVRQKVAAARGRVHVDVALWGGLTPGNLERVDELADAGVRGFKCFLADTGIPEFAPLSPTHLIEALRRVGATGLPLLVHAEDTGALAAHADNRPTRSYDEFLSHHPVSVETQAITDVVAAVAATRARAHIVHVSSGAGVALIAAARAAGLPISGETCPHHLVLDVASAADGDTLVKVSPPVRSGEAGLLWEGLRTGALDLVVSDHSPCALADKLLGPGDLEAAVGGIASLQIGLPLVWTAARDRGFTLVDVARWMAQRPAELAGLDNKGAIAVGRDADLCVLDPRATFVVERGALAHRLTRTPYDGRRLTGLVTQTWLAGSPVDLDHPRGRVLLRGHDTIPSDRRSHP